MGQAPTQVSRALGQLLRGERQKQRLTLREVSERLEERGQPIPTSTLTRIEQGELDPGVRRLFVLLDLLQIPGHLVADLVQLESLAGEIPETSDPDELLEAGLAAWRQGEIGRGLACLFALRERAGDAPATQLARQKAMLSFAATARDLGKFRLGRQIIDDLLCEPPHPSLMANTLVLASSLWLGLGSGQVASALIHQARRSVQPKNLKQGAWVFHQEAKILLETGRPREADRALAQALARYRKLNDHYGETRCETLRIRVLEALGQPAAALRCAERVVRGAERHEHTRLAVMGRLEHGRLLVAAGQPDEAVTILRAGLAGAVVLGDRNAQLLAHHRLWKAYASLGDEEQARVELAAATQLVRFVDDRSPEAEELRALAKGGAR